MPLPKKRKTLLQIDKELTDFKSLVKKQLSKCDEDIRILAQRIYELDDNDLPTINQNTDNISEALTNHKKVLEDLQRDVNEIQKYRDFKVTGFTKVKTPKIKKPYGNN